MRTTNSTTTGHIAGVQDCGSIIIVNLRTCEGWLSPIFFDHTPFRWLLEGEQCGPEELIGRHAEYDGNTLIFLD